MITYREWFRGTDKIGWARTPELQAVDRAVQTYERSPSQDELEDLCIALSKWAMLKGLGPDAKIRTNRNQAVVCRLINETTQMYGRTYGPWFAHDLLLARRLCDAFLSKRVIGQDLSGSDADVAKYKAGSGQSHVAVIGELAKARENENANLKPSALRGGGANTHGSLDFWYKKGEREAAAPDGSGLWCDASAALICYLLARNPNFKSRLDVVSQGDPTQFGHWYVVANRVGGDLLTFGSLFGPNNGKDNFTIDIWGAIRGEEETSVIRPACAIYDCDHETGAVYDHNDIAVRCVVPRKPV